jgi:integrase
MTTNQIQKFDSTSNQTPGPAIRHTHQDALSDREFERLLDACEELREPYQFDARLICLLGGRLGLRRGEIAHFCVDWLDWDRKLIRIPAFDPCNCGYCLRQARSEARNSGHLTKSEALAGRWHPKTAASARVIPFDISLRVELCIEGFAARYERFPKSVSTINRRLSEVVAHSDIDGRVYPHCLRATAASYHSYRGVTPVPLQGLMG